MGVTEGKSYESLIFFVPLEMTSSSFINFDIKISNPDIWLTFPTARDRSIVGRFSPPPEGYPALWEQPETAPDGRT